MTTSTAKSDENGEDLLDEQQVVTSPLVSPFPPRLSMENRRWENRWKSLIVTIAFAIGTGNVWRFPALCMQHGGVIFVLQYTLCFVFCAVPLFLLETAVGQFCSLSPYSIFPAIVPIMGGLSSAMSFILVVRYSTLAVWISHSLTFLSLSFKGIFGEIPWSSCENQEKTCYDFRLAKSCAYSNSSECFRFQDSLLSTRGTLTRRTPFIHFVARNIFKISSVVSEFDVAPWFSYLSLVFVWILMGVATFGGQKVLKRTACISTTVPFVVYSAMLGIGFSLPNSLDGIAFFFHHPLEKIHDLGAWTDAAAQAIFSLNLASGGILYISSLRGFSQPIQSDVHIVSFVSYLFSILVTVTAFLFAGHFAAEIYPEETPIKRLHLLLEGEHYIQSIFPEVLADFSFGWILIAIYFTAEFLLGAQAMITSMWVVLAMFRDRRSKYKGLPAWNMKMRLFVVASLSLAGLFSGLFLIASNGLPLLFVIDQYISYATVAVALLELVTFTYLYGFRRIVVNIRSMVNCHSYSYVAWFLNWLLITPLLLSASLLMAILSLFLLPLQLPAAFVVIGWAATILPIMFVIVYGCVQNFKRCYGNATWKSLIESSNEWGPFEENDRTKAVTLERALRVR